MNKVLEGMARAYNDATEQKMPRWRPSDTEWLDPIGFQAALLWLAANVSDEMADTADDACDFNSVRAAMRSEDWRFCISAALRAAAGSAPTTPEGME